MKCEYREMVNWKLQGETEVLVEGGGQTYSSAILLTTTPIYKVLLAHLLQDWLLVFESFLRYLFLFKYHWRHTARLN